MKNPWEQEETELIPQGVFQYSPCASRVTVWTEVWTGVLKYLAGQNRCRTSGPLCAVDWALQLYRHLADKPSHGWSVLNNSISLCACVQLPETDFFAHLWLFAGYIPQAFSEYQIQQMTANFVDQFGFNDEEFADQDDNIKWVQPLWMELLVLYWLCRPPGLQSLPLVQGLRWRMHHPAQLKNVEDWLWAWKNSKFSVTGWLRRNKSENPAARALLGAWKSLSRSSSRGVVKDRLFLNKVLCLTTISVPAVLFN